MPNHKRVFTQEETDKILLLYDNEHTVYDITKKLHTTKKAVRECLISNNREIRKQGYKTHFNKGNIPWNKDLKGIHLSPESQFKKGMIPWNKGNVNPNTEIRDIIRSREEFNQWRIAVYKRDSNICQLCGHKHSNKIPINAHHIYNLIDIINDCNITTLEEAYACDVLWNINNGISLCIVCHKRVHRGEVVI